MADITRFSYNAPADEFYKARISTLERENEKLKAKLEKNAAYYGLGKDMFEAHMKELQDENDKLVDENMRLREALIREATRDV